MLTCSCAGALELCFFAARLQILLELQHPLLRVWQLLQSATELLCCCLELLLQQLDMSAHHYQELSSDEDSLTPMFGINPSK